MVMVFFSLSKRPSSTSRWTFRCSSRCPSRSAIHPMVIVLGFSLKKLGKVWEVQGLFRSLGELDSLQGKTKGQQLKGKIVS